MSKQKPSGLSKKIPAIFQGLPALENGGQSASVPPSASGKTPAPDRVKKRFGPACLVFSLSESSAKMMVMYQKGNRWEEGEVRELENPASGQGRVAFDWNSLTDWLKQMIAEFEGNAALDIRILLTGSSVHVTTIEKPEVSARELRDAVVWQIAENLPFPVEESEVRYEERNGSMVVAVIEKNFLDAVIKSFHDAKLYPSLITLLPMSYEALDKRFQLFAPSNLLLIHIMANHTSLLVFKNGKFLNMREMKVGGEHVTRAMMGTLVVDNATVNIAYQEAQVLKETLGMPTPGLASDPAEPKHSQLSARIRPIFEKMTMEFKTTIAQFRREWGKDIEEIRLSGGGAEMGGIEEYFSDQLGLPVRRINLAASDLKFGLATTGLAGVAYASPVSLNFAAPEDLWKPVFERWCAAAKKGVGVTLLCLVLAVLMIGMKILFIQQEAHGYQKKLAALSVDDRKLAELDAMIQKISLTQSRRNALVHNKIEMKDVLREMSRIVPQALVFEEISFNREPEPVISISGRSRSGERTPDLILSSFLEKIDESPYFKNASLASRTGSGDAPLENLKKDLVGVQFEIQAEMEGIDR